MCAVPTSHGRVLVSEAGERLRKGSYRTYLDCASGASMRRDLTAPL
jgi:hypothetical protein